MIFSIHPSSYPVHPQPDEHTIHLMSSTVSPLSFPQPITFFLLATSTRVAFHAVDLCAALRTPLPSCSSSLFHDFLYFFKMTSYASLVKSNKTRQGDTLQMRRGDAVAKQVKKINKTKKKRRRKKKKTRLPRPVSQPNLWIQQQPQRPISPTGFPFFILLRRAAAVRQG
jgi:hypothetical protein